MGVRVLIVQHGEKERLPGDPGLTHAGHDQARRTAAWLSTRWKLDAVWSSPLRRATETAAPIVERCGLDLVIDRRLRERMNWNGPGSETMEEFLQDWARSSVDRGYEPRHGDSSVQAADRFLAALDDVAAAHPNGAVAVVGHGGVTVDVLRTLLGDDRLHATSPRLVDDGVPAGSASSSTGSYA